MGGVNPNPRLQDGDAVIIMPPFGGLYGPSLGAHLLQACAREAGLQVRVLYANMLLAAQIGASTYESICHAATSLLIGERLFAAAAYGVPPLGRIGPDVANPLRSANCGGDLPVEFGEIQKIESTVAEWLRRIASAVLRQNFRVIGCTTTFEQTAASVALLKQIKQQRPDVVTIIGGANCDGVMADGLSSLCPSIDYVFSGECESTFPRFLQNVLAGNSPETRVIRGTPCLDLDSIPTPDFTEFYEQFREYLPGENSNDLLLLYESSRGCWWGEKHHCTFCGINGSTMTFRAKSPDRVIAELKRLLPTHPSKKVCMVDNIMPHAYFKTLIPRLASQTPDLEIFYEQKANLSLAQVAALKGAGVTTIQPGIEALASDLLKLMDKGVSARQNIALLRYARAVDLAVNWNLLYAFPGDRLESYLSTLALIPLIHHLAPPTDLYHLSIDRFSPYFDSPDSYQIRNPRPIDAYYSLLPDNAPVENVAYHFVADYHSESRDNPGVIQELNHAVLAWRRAWQAPDRAAPVLAVAPVSDEHFLLIDTRGLPETDEFQFLSRDEVAVVLAGAPVGRRDELEWALDRKLLVELDSCLVPLATASPELLQQFELASRATRTAAPLPVLAS